LEEEEAAGSAVEAAAEASAAVAADARAAVAADEAEGGVDLNAECSKRNAQCALE
jgi:hypothetical protein